MIAYLKEISFIGKEGATGCIMQRLREGVI
jgi:hypothetical protein